MCVSGVDEGRGGRVRVCECGVHTVGKTLEVRSWTTSTGMGPTGTGEMRYPCLYCVLVPVPDGRGMGRDGEGWMGRTSCAAAAQQWPAEHAATACTRKYFFLLCRPVQPREPGSGTLEAYRGLEVWDGTWRGQHERAGGMGQVRRATTRTGWSFHRLTGVTSGTRRFSLVKQKPLLPSAPDLRPMDERYAVRIRIR